MRIDDDVIARFESKVERDANDNGCDLWVGAKTEKGYAEFTIARRKYRGHRVAVFIDGRNPEGFVVRHGSGCERHCVNPEHLTVGTQQDNMRDKFRDGTVLRGEMLGHSKLTEEQVLDIFERANSGEPQPVIAAEYGVAQSQVSNIKTGRAWGWLTQPQT